MLRAETHISFDEIFEKTLFSEEKLRTEDLFKTSSEQPLEWSSDLEPQHLSYLLGHLEVHRTTTFKDSQNPYLKYKKVIQKPNLKTNLKPDHALSLKELVALEFINLHLAKDLYLPKNFTLTQLKHAYKKAALRTHPDCGGSHNDFLKLKSSSELLMAFLKSLA